MVAEVLFVDIGHFLQLRAKLFLFAAECDIVSELSFSLEPMMIIGP